MSKNISSGADTLIELKGLGSSMRPCLGFTLVELMVALALSLFLIGGVLVTYISGRAASIEAETLSRMQENIRFASDYLIRDIRNAGFRDHQTLTFWQYQQIGERFAEYGDEDQAELIIRYAGRGACGRVFQDNVELKIIQNRYFRANNGDLRCEGTEIDESGAVSTIDPVTLASGLTSLRFDFIYPTGVAAGTVCNFFENDDVETACIGVDITVGFADVEPRVAQLTAAFRNVIVDRIYVR